MANTVGNTKLVEYGILNEDSNYRAHVCPQVERVYVYDTFAGVEAIQSGRFEVKEATQRCDCFMDPRCNICGGEGRLITAKGYRVPPISIEGCREVVLTPHWWSWIKFNAADPLDRKGRKAMRLIVGMLKRGRFPLKCLPKEITDHDLQIKGADVWVKTVAKIQVKCDYPGGPKALGGTGFLYLQVEECNPFKLH